MTAAWYWWRATNRRTWKSTLLLIVLSGMTGAVALAAVAGAQRTESAYARYLGATNASDVTVNIPTATTTPIALVAHMPGVTRASAWLGLDANPIVDGHVDDAFPTDGMAGSQHGEFFTQDRVTVLRGRLPPLTSTHDIILTPGIARLFGVGVGGQVSYQFENPLESDVVVPLAVGTFRVAAIAEEPPVLVDQFDNTQGALLPPAATARYLKEVEFSWVGLRLARGSAGIPALLPALRRIGTEVGAGDSLSFRELDTVHQQVQEAIRPQAVALAIFGGFAALALLLLAGQGLAQLFDRAAPDFVVLRALGSTRRGQVGALVLKGAVVIVGGMALAVTGAYFLSPLAPVGPVRQFDPVRGLQFDSRTLLLGGLLLLAALFAVTLFLAWRATEPVGETRLRRESAFSRIVAAARLPVTPTLGIRYGLEAPPGERRGPVRVGVLASVAAITALVTAVIFAASLNGLVTHPVRYGWNWDVLIQAEGGYGNFQGYNLSKLVDEQHGVTAWSTFSFPQLPIDGQAEPLLGLATRRGAVSPPTVSGHPLEGPDQIELGSTTLAQLGKHVGDTVLVGNGKSARRLRVVGVVTLPSIGLQLADDVSLGRGGMVPESTLLAIEDLGPNSSFAAFASVPSTIALDVDTPADADAVARRIAAANPDGTPGGTYRVPRVLGAAVVNAGQMGGQPITLAVVLAAVTLASLSAIVVAGVRRRRRELAVLRTLGLSRGQVRAVIGWHALTVLVVAVAIGLPLGILAGRWLWSSFATSIGVLPITAIPLQALLPGLAAIVIVGTVFTALPAVVLAREQPATALRAS